MQNRTRRHSANTCHLTNATGLDEAIRQRRKILFDDYMTQIPALC